MTYTLRLLTAESRDLVVEALRAEASKRARVAQRAAVELAPDRAARKDVRAASVRVTDLLAEAGRLDQLADELAAAQDVPLVAGPVPPLAVTEPAAAVVLTDAVDPSEPDPDVDDDGLSPAAHALAALAGLDDARLDEDDPTLDTGATVEDDPDAIAAADPDDPTRAAIAAADAAIIDGALG